MTRHGLVFMIFTLVGAALVLPEPSYARGAGFRPAFTGGPFRIVAPGFGPRMHGGPRMSAPGRFRGPAIGAPRTAAPRTAFPSAIPGPGRPAARSANAFRLPPGRYHRRVGGLIYPFTIGADSSYFGTPYDPSDDIPAYTPPPGDDSDDADAPPPPRGPAITMAPAYPAPSPQRGCRAEHVTVPAASGSGDREVTIVRC